MDIRIQIRPIYKPRRVATEPDAGLKIAVAEAFVEEAGGVFFLAVGALEVGIAAGMGEDSAKALLP